VPFPVWSLPQNLFPASQANRMVFIPDIVAHPADGLPALRAIGDRIVLGMIIALHFSNSNNI
jgi:hypothetical protein